MSDKAHLSVVVCGHVDAGKSTTCGHLIFKCGGIPEREMAKLQERAEEMGKASFGFAYFLDTCKEERERGVSPSSATPRSSTPTSTTTLSLMPPAIR